MSRQITVPAQGYEIINRLYHSGYEGYFVGGCVRDALIGRKAHDWDIATSATPEQVKALFDHVIPTGEKHGTVTVMMEEMAFEVTTFREDGEYTDGRRPDKIEFLSDIRSDLSRRDFTINAIAYNPRTGIFIDLFQGMKHLDERKIIAVGTAENRFKEDALRMLRGIRLSAQLGFGIDSRTLIAMKNNNHLIKKVSVERIRDELCKMLLSDEPDMAIGTLHMVGLLEHFLPELSRCFGFDQQNPHHNKDVGDHILAVTAGTPARLKVRLAGLFHDIGKPDTFELVMVDDKPRGRFYGHQTVGAEMTREIMARLKFSSEMINDVCALVQDHMSRVTNLRPKNIKRLINRVGDHNMQDLFDLMRADVLGHKPPFNYGDIDEMEAEYEKVKTEVSPMAIKDLAINGDDLIQTGIQPGPIMGNILNNLLEVVLDNPAFNTKEKLLEIVEKGIGNFINQEAK
jgi:tRNA nucleotidyltransferase (CCA-adding enzyme)